MEGSSSNAGSMLSKEKQETQIIAMQLLKCRSNQKQNCLEANANIDK